MPSDVRPIVGVSTSTTAFVGRARMGPVDEPTSVYGYADYERTFGGLWSESRMSFAVHHYFQNGGREAVIVRVTRGAAPEATRARWSLSAGGAGDLLLEAASPGTWANELIVAADHETGPPGEPRFNLTVTDPGSGASETLRNLVIDPAAPTHVVDVLAQRSRFLRAVEGALPTQRPDAGAATVVAAGADGGPIRNSDVMPGSGAGGVRALKTAGEFSLLCLPPLDGETDLAPATYAAVEAHLGEVQRRAMLIVDPPATAGDPAAARSFATQLNLPSDRAALFFPRLLMPNPLKDGLIEEFAPSGAIAGVFARTDAQRGVWKAPAGIEARLAGVSGLTRTLSDGEVGELNPEGINCIRGLPQAGTVLWGSRTLRGADSLADQWKYVPVRRTAFFIEDSLFRGLKWVVFEPNDEPLWAQIRLNVGAFLNGMFRQGAFQGKTPKQAYFVHCDAQTTTQEDIDRGVVNVVVGFAPLKPAEFVVIQIQQMAGQGTA